jgi:type VII secretion-associated serine protease mycosin
LTGLVALGTAALVTAAIAVPAFAADAPNPNQNQNQNESASPTDAGGSPTFTATGAAAKAAKQYEARATDLRPIVPLVTVEQTASGPKVLSHRVSTAEEARAVASNAAGGDDLVGVDLDHVVQSVGTLPASTDPGLLNQWNLKPDKTSFVNAWKTTKGAGITVAVIDTGVDASHPDLKGKVLTGHEFLNHGGTDRDVKPMTDNCGHGTHVAGTIAAVTNNGIGIAGAAPDVKILPVRVLDCGGWSSDVAKGIVWAANKGARVINLSLGGPGPDSALANAVKYARSKNAVVVAAAGNNHGQCTSGKNKTVYPGASTGAIGVGAVDSNLQHACFSNTGTYVDIAAPGVDILAPLPKNQYDSWDGTSMATPHIAAAAALVLAYRSTCTPDQVELRLESTARKLPLGTPGDTRRYGAGLVDPARALTVLKALKGKC